MCNDSQKHYVLCNYTLLLLRTYIREFTKVDSNVLWWASHALHRYSGSDTPAKAVLFTSPKTNELLE